MAQPLDLAAVDEAVLELEMAADMVGMSMRRDGDDRLLEKVPRRLAQADDAHAGIDHEVAVAPPDVPDVAAHERHDIGLPEQGDRIVDTACLEPAFGDLDRHGVLPQAPSG